MMLTTKNYSTFKPHPANREISRALVLKLKPSMQQHGWLEGRPLLLNAKNEILDGQHRLENAKNLNLSVPYVVLDGDGEAQIIALNANQSPWKIIDYIRSYSVQNKDNYRKLLKFENKYKLGITNSIDVFVLDTVKVNTTLRSGEDFKINPDADAIVEYINACDIAFNKTSKFVRSIVQIFKRLDQKQRNIIKASILRVPMLNSEGEYLQVFENILNGKKRKNRIKLLPTKRIAQ